MSDSDITIEDAEASLLRSVDAGIEQFSDGTNSVKEHSLESRTEAIKHLKRTEAAADPFGSLKSMTLRGGGAWQ